MAKKLSSGLTYEVKDGKMIIEIDLSANPEQGSKSGKNHMVATTGPAAVVSGGKLKEGAKLQVNLYEPW